ncbi:MAG: hypothetical protein ACM3QV_00135 [Caulobacteraceae bacterium]
MPTPLVAPGDAVAPIVPPWAPGDAVAPTVPPLIVAPVILDSTGVAKLINMAVNTSTVMTFLKTLMLFTYLENNPIGFKNF